MRLIEQQFTVPKFDANDPYLLKDVRILGVESRNGGGKRRYKLDALRAAIPLFEGEGVSTNHNYEAAEKGRPRDYTDRLGFLRDVKCDDAGLYGDWQLNPKLAISEAIKWDYEHGTKKVGLSWIGDGDCDPGTQDVFRINKVFSVDMVQKPATTTSLREAEEEEPEEKRNWGDTEEKMLTSHEDRLGAHDTKLAEHDSKLGEHDAKWRAAEDEHAKSESELQTKVANLLSEVEQLKASVNKTPGVHIHPDLNGKKLITRTSPRKSTRFANGRLKLSPFLVSHEEHKNVNRPSSIAASANHHRANRLRVR